MKSTVLFYSLMSFMLRVVYQFLINYPTPAVLSYFWNFGFYSLGCLCIQILSGIFLAMFYSPEITLAFESINYIMRDVSLGWLLRYFHANGASFFFIAVYLHLFRGLYYASYLYPRQGLWVIGLIILFLMIIVAFLGYVLPWGQMSFWAATVITSMVTALPYIGDMLIYWIWGSTAVENATLKRFFSLHYFLPFLLIFFVYLHLLFLHEHGSGNPLGLLFCKVDIVYMYPYYVLKDLFGLIIYFLFFILFIFFFPEVLGHTDNYILANPLSTPSHIVPEWYFLPFYSILRSIPDKFFGVFALLMSIAVIGLLPYYYRNIVNISSIDFLPFTRVLYWFFFFNCILLGWLGCQVAEAPYIQVAQFSTFFYFTFFLFISPIGFIFERRLFLLLYN